MGSCLTLFLGGTVGESKWRDELIPFLEHEKLSYYNPVVDDWNDAARDAEMAVKSSPNTVEAYVITKDMKGVFSIAEAVDASNKKPDRTIFMVQREGFDQHQLNSLDATLDLIKKNGAYIVSSLYGLALTFKGIELEHRAKRVSIIARREKLSE